MYLLKIVDDNDMFFSTRYYEYDNEKQMLDVARNLAGKGVECVVFKPYKKFERPEPLIKEVDM